MALKYSNNAWVVDKQNLKDIVVDYFDDLYTLPPNELAELLEKWVLIKRRVKMDFSRYFSINAGARLRIRSACLPAISSILASFPLTLRRCMIDSDEILLRIPFGILECQTCGFDGSMSVSTTEMKSHLILNEVTIGT
ncbi:hypothetical protein V2J09_009569 [Rumex salicifolius]